MRLVRAWRDDWARTYTEEERLLVITPDSDLKALGEATVGREPPCEVLYGIAEAGHLPIENGDALDAVENLIRQA